MTDRGECADYLNLVVDLLVPIYRDEWGHTAGNRTGRLHPWIDAAPSVCHLETVLGPGGAAPLAGDGGDPRLTAREFNDALVVVADLAGIERDDRRTEIDLGEDSVTLDVDGRTAWQIPVQRRPTSIADVSINNDVLSFRVDVE